MKKIILSLSLIGLLGMVSCSDDDFLQYDPSGESESETAITNENQLAGAVLGIYDGLQSEYLYGNYYITAQELLSDNGFVIFQNSNRFTDFNRYEHTISSGGSISNMWTMGYRAIGRANLVLSYEGVIEGPTVQNSFAEARALRALVLFNLVNYYARPYGTTHQELGIPVPEGFKLGEPIARKSVEEVYNEIIDELKLAAESLTTTEKTAINKNAVYGLLSRVYLYKKDYVKAIEYADLALANSTLLEAGDVLSYYADASSSSETLFAVGFTALDNPGTNEALFATWTTNGTYKQNAATSEFYNIIPSTDTRKGLYEQWSTNDNPLPYGVKKFGALDYSVIVVRATEVLLNKIEALYHTNPTQAQTELVNWVQSYRDTSYSFSGSGQALLDEILNQRRIELAFEGHRYFDMNRHQTDVQKGANCTINCSMPFSEHRRVFPIPLNEMQTNTAIVQNPGYNQ